MRLLMIICAAISYLSSCTSFIEGSNNITVVDRGVASYSEISVEDGLKLVVSNTPRNSVTVTANDNVQQYIETSVRGNTLVVGVKRGASFRNVTILVNVSGVGVKAISASGGANVEVNRCPLASDVDINLSGGSTMSGIVDVLTLDAEISGGSDLNIQGLPAQVINLESSGGSKSKMQEAQVANIEVSGGGKAYVWVSRIMNVEVSGGSIVYYKGAGVIGEIESSGGSEIKRTDW